MGSTSNGLIREGVVSMKDLIQSYRRSVVAMFATPNGMRWWRNSSSSGMWDSAFVSMVNELIADAQVLTESRYLKIFE